MTATNSRAQVHALLWLAGGKSNREAAEQAGVSQATVSAWRKKPVFAEELAVLTELWQQHPQDYRAFMARLDEAEQRLAPVRSGSSAVEAGGVRVRVSIPAGAAPGKAERLIARGIARGLRAAREAES
ncbi:hypothetical protein [Streptomyces adustus]|uniref:hypothetical protein n=1 Tax=Streptomyces adustus TaxID=1609272 RepID=UPI0037136D9B